MSISNDAAALFREAGLGLCGNEVDALPVCIRDSLRCH